MYTEIKNWKSLEDKIGRDTVLNDAEIKELRWKDQGGYLEFIIKTNEMNLAHQINIRLFFTDVRNLKIDDFYIQNVISELQVQKNEDNLSIIFVGDVGADFSFECKKAELEILD